MTVAVWNELFDVCQELIQGLGLSWTPPGSTDPALPLPTTSVYIREVESDQNVTIPNVQVVRGGVEEELPGSFEDTVVIYPVKVVHTFIADQSHNLNRDVTLWRQLILDTFEHIPRPEVTQSQADVFDCIVTFNPPIDPSQFSRNDLAVGGMLLKFTTTRHRPGR